MKLGSIILRGGLLALFLSGGRSDGGNVSAYPAIAQELARPAPQKPAPAKVTPPAARATTVAPAELPPIAARGKLLQRLPRTTLCALRLPHVEKLKAAYERTSLHELMEMPQFALQRAQVAAAYGQMGESISKEIPDYDALKDQVLALEGELVVAIISLDAQALSKSGDEISGCPLTCALMFDAGAHANDVDALLQRGFKLLDEKAKSRTSASPTPELHAEVVASSADGWVRRMRPEGASIEIAREGSQFLLQIGPAVGTGRQSAPLQPRALADSFLAADVVRGTPDLATQGAEPVVEGFLNLEPVWSAVELLAPAEAKSILAETGATSVRGLSVAAALGKTGIDEVLLVHSPGGNDLLTRVLTNRPLDAKLARFVPSESRAASLGTLDVAALFEAVTKLLPDVQQRSLEAAFASQKKDGFDVRRDLIDNIGPTFGCVGDTDLFRLFSGQGAAAGDIDTTLIVQLKDAPRFRALVERFLARGGLDKHTKTTDIHGFSVTAFEPIPVPRPDGKVAMTIEPHVYVAEDALLFSLSRLGMQRALAAALHDTNRGPVSMQAALNGDASSSAFSIGVTAPAAGLVGSTTIGRRTALGLEMVQREGPGTGGTYVLAGGLAIAASLAIPQLLAARSQADEKAAVATLRSIASSEAQFSAAGVIDSDGDGIGEYGTLAELTGAATVRGTTEVLEPPVLGASMKPDAKGLVQRSGYVFRIDVSEPPEGAARTARRGAPAFTAYAWPIRRGDTGVNAYSIDSEGDLLVSDNRGSEQRYEGTTRTPKAGATIESQSILKGQSGGGRPERGERPARPGRTGRDGGIWRILE